VNLISTLQWSQEEPAAEIETGEQLDELLDQLQAKCPSDLPTAAVLRVHDCETSILIGLQESFVYIDDIGKKRYYITVGDVSSGGVVTFYLLGQHHTEFERRHLIPLATARRVAREFFDSGRLPSGVKWEEILY
jgi:hypothetical protein